MTVSIRLDAKIATLNLLSLDLSLNLARPTWVAKGAVCRSNQRERSNQTQKRSDDVQRRTLEEDGSQGDHRGGSPGSPNLVSWRASLNANRRDAQRIGPCGPLGKGWESGSATIVRFTGVLVMAVLRRVGDPEGVYYPIREPIHVVGRNPESDLHLTANGVSRSHFQVRRVHDRYFLHDLHSRNKTLLNRQEIEPGIDCPLKDGDRIGVCDVELIFYERPPLNTQSAVVLIDTEADNQLQSLDATQHGGAVCSIVHPETKLKAVLEITRNLSSELKIDVVAPKVVDSLLKIFPQAERGFLVLIDPDDPKRERLVRKAFKYRQPPGRSLSNSLSSTTAEEPPMRLSRNVVNDVIANRKAVLLSDADRNLPTSESMVELKLRSIMCVPLITPSGEVLGIIQVDTTSRDPFRPEDLEVLAAVASQAAITIETANLSARQIQNEVLTSQLNAAADVQRLFLPTKTPDLPGHRFYSFYQANYRIGGDFYDFIQLDQDVIAVALGDVAGKGIAAAMVMAKYSGENRFLISTQRDPARALGELNRSFCQAGIEGKFITLSVCLYHLKERTLKFSSAGHFPLLVRRYDGRVEELGGHLRGLPIGVDEEAEYYVLETVLEPGDVVILYSDGITDARNLQDEAYDSHKNRRLVRRVGELGGNARDVGVGLLQDVREFMSGQLPFDDMTLVCFGPEVPPSTSLSASDLAGIAPADATRPKL
ncbi:protein serine phosphatase with GAF(s) sensor(s) [Isosphaera pallida ATCC 43644]|uniref:Protein serine phosphatase with GAF(S) sensor(S) n=2 Tax=Isosphaera pallida TaxID=128 RepID=E8R2B0_ISOPI|nr:protein serine phosphatase with GAF(s) sensor(s) [Isosphaera pallida ATCC 43644]